MPGLYSHTTRATGTILTATIYNGDHQNHIDNAIPQQHDDYSSSVPQMQTATDPGEVGSESLATSTAGELERLRFALREIKGTPQWYESPTANLNAISQPGFRNKILNGNFLFNEFGQGASAATDIYLCDGWVMKNNAVRLTGQQITFSGSNAPGAIGRLQATVTAGGVTNPGDLNCFVTGVEGYDFTTLSQFSTSGAKVVTLSFWVNSTVIGTYAVAFTDNVNSRSYVTTYTVNVASTWEYKTITIPGDVAGVNWNGTVFPGIKVYFVWGAGSNFITTANVWQNSNSSNMRTVAGATQLTTVPAAIASIALVQLEMSNSATPYDYVSTPQEQARMHRYAETVYGRFDGVVSAGGHQWLITLPFKSVKRFTPNVTYATDGFANVSTFDFLVPGPGARDSAWLRIVSTGPGGFSFEGRGFYDSRMTL